MQTFKTFFKILRARGSALVIYIAVFFALALVIGGTGGNQEEFAATSLRVGVINRNNHAISAALVEYLHDLHDITYLQDSYTVAEDEVFFERLAFVLIIDNGFGEQFAAGQEPALRYLVAPQATAAEIFVSRQLDAFLQNLSGYIAAGFDYRAGLELTLQDMQQRVTVSVAEGSVQISPFLTATVFITTSLIIVMLAPTLVRFKEKELYSRLAISATSKRKRTVGLIVASLVCVALVWAGVMVVTSFFHHESLLSVRGSLHMLNVFIYALVVAGLAVFMSSITRNQDAIDGCTTLFSVLLSFTGGAFVPTGLFSDTMRTIAQFFPSFWFNHTNQVVYNSIFTGTFDTTGYLWGIGIQLAFIVAFFSVALVVGKEKAE